MISSLRLIKNNRAVMKIARLTDGALWPRNLPAPVMVEDTEVKMRAVSLLCGMQTRDSIPVFAFDLTADQARDVVKARG